MLPEGRESEKAGKVICAGVRLSGMGGNRRTYHIIYHILRYHFIINIHDIRGNICIVLLYCELIIHTDESTVYTYTVE